MVRVSPENTESESQTQTPHTDRDSICVNCPEKATHTEQVNSDQWLRDGRGGWE